MVCSFVSTRVYACTLDVLGALPWPPEYIQWRCLHEALLCRSFQGLRLKQDLRANPRASHDNSHQRARWFGVQILGVGLLA